MHHAHCPAPTHAALHRLTAQLSRSAFDEIVKSVSHRRTVDPAAPPSLQPLSAENRKEKGPGLPGGSNGGNGSGSVVMDTLFRWLDADRSNALSKSEVAALLPLLHQV